MANLIDPPYGAALTKPLWTEKLALLSMLNKTPADPDDDRPPPQDIKKSIGGTLSIEMETDLVDGIAFIAALDEGPGHVLAVAIKAHTGGESLTMRIASNRANLSETRKGLKTTGRIL